MDSFPSHRSGARVKELSLLTSLSAVTLLKWVSVCPVQQPHINKVNYADCLLI